MGDMRQTVGQKLSFRRAKKQRSPVPLTDCPWPYWRLRLERTTSISWAVQRPWGSLKLAHQWVYKCRWSGKTFDWAFLEVCDRYAVQTSLRYQQAFSGHRLAVSSRFEWWRYLPNPDHRDVTIDSNNADRCAVTWVRSDRRSQDATQQPPSMRSSNTVPACRWGTSTPRCN